MKQENEAKRNASKVGNSSNLLDGSTTGDASSNNGSNAPIIKTRAENIHERIGFNPIPRNTTWSSISHDCYGFLANIEIKCIETRTSFNSVQAPIKIKFRHGRICWSDQTEQCWFVFALCLIWSHCKVPNIPTWHPHLAELCLAAQRKTKPVSQKVSFVLPN